jgi:hypothetical protein
MASHEQQSPRSAETEEYSNQTMSSNAASEAIAIANQEEWAKDSADSIQDSVDDIDDLLDEMERELEEESLVLNFKQKGGQ